MTRPRPNTARLEKEIVSFSRRGVEYASRCGLCGGEVRAALRDCRLVLICAAGCDWSTGPLVDQAVGATRAETTSQIASRAAQLTKLITPAPPAMEPLPRVAQTTPKAVQPAPKAVRPAPKAVSPVGESSCLAPEPPTLAATTALSRAWMLRVWREHFAQGETIHAVAMWCVEQQERLTRQGQVEKSVSYQRVYMLCFEIADMALLIPTGAKAKVSSHLCSADLPIYRPIHNFFEVCRPTDEVQATP